MRGRLVVVSTTVENSAVIAPASGAQYWTVVDSGRCSFSPSRTSGGFRACGFAASAVRFTANRQLVLRDGHPPARPIHRSDDAEAYP